MERDQIIAILNDSKVLDNTTDNMVLSGDVEGIENEVPAVIDITSIDGCLEGVAFNISIDLSEIKVQDILSYTLNYLRFINIIPSKEEFNMPFTSKYDLALFKKVLDDNEITVQFILSNLDDISIEDQMLLNELYYYKTPAYSVISLTKHGLLTYFLSDGRVLDDEENLTSYTVEEPFVRSIRQD